MRFQYLLLTLSITFVGGCASNSEDFVINGKALRIEAKLLNKIRSSWGPSSVDAAKKSSIRKTSIAWSMDFIATVEAGRTLPCGSLELTEIDTAGLAPIIGRAQSGKSLTFLPKSYHEIWIVSSCGQNRRWHIFDEASDPVNPHRVILANAA